MDIKNSVHLQDFPVINNFEADKKLIDIMDKIRAICSCALYVRDKNNLRVRLPLNKITVISDDCSDIKDFSDIITDEINVKTIDFDDKIEDYGKEKLILNFQKIGSKVGAKMPSVMKAAENKKWKIKDNNILEIDGFELNNDEYSIKLEAKKENVFAVTGYNILIQLDLNITTELEKEGMARDLVRLIQQFRKDVKLDVSDKIDLTIKTGYDFLRDSVESFKDYIKEQTLSTNLTIAKEKDELNTDFSFCEEINKNIIQIGFSKI